MSNLLTAGASGAGRFIPTKAQLAHVGFGQCRIANFDPNLIYNISVTSGTASRSSDLISLSSGNTILSVLASSVKGGISTASTFERKQYTYTTRTSTTTGTCCSTSYYCTGCFCCDSPCACSNPSWGQCGCTPQQGHAGPMCWTGCGNYTSCYSCSSTTTYQEKDSYTSSSFIDTYGEWVKII